MADEPEPTVAETVRRAPKVLLHDHLDGGLRPATIVELAAEVGPRSCPPTDAESLGRWFAESADSGSLERYLETFDHTVAVMQRADHLTRVARECVEDLAADGVVYAEVRYAPEQHLERRPHPRGGRRGGAGRVRRGDGRPGRRPDRRTPAADRDAAPGPLARDRRARRRSTATTAWSASTSPAPRPGYPPTRHLDAFEYLQRENAHFTIHAGEAFGLPSIWQAIQWCGADRLGHGVRIIDDIAVDGDGDVAARPARGVRPRQADPARDVPALQHPDRRRRLDRRAPDRAAARLRFRVTVNTDNRLMSGTSMTREMSALVEAFGWDLADLQWFTVNAMKSAFCPSTSGWS